MCPVQATEYDLLQLAKPPHTGSAASVAFVAPCRREALWLEEGLAANAQSLRPSLRSLCEPCERVCAALEATSGSATSSPCAPDRHACAPKRPLALDAIGHRLRRGTRRSRRDYHSRARTRSCSVTTCGNGRLSSASALNRRVSSCIQEGIQGSTSLLPAGGVCSLAETDFRRCLLQWGAAESPKALGGKHARRSNTQSVRRAPAPPSPFGHDSSLVTPSPTLQLLRWAPRSCSHHAHH